MAQQQRRIRRRDVSAANGRTSANRNGAARDRDLEHDVVSHDAGDPVVEERLAAASAAHMDLPRIQRAVREILLAIGENPDREGLRDTPARVARMYAELFAGLHQDPEQHLKAMFDEDHHEMVVLRDIAFNSTCEHHLMPFEGKAHIAYIPGGKVLGLSKLARIVDVFAHRPQVQERLTSQIADLLAQRLHVKGCAVVMEAVHTCMTCRGVKKPGSVMITSALRGVLHTNPSTRAEVLALLHNKH